EADRQDEPAVAVVLGGRGGSRPGAGRDDRQLLRDRDEGNARAQERDEGNPVRPKGGELEHGTLLRVGRAGLTTPPAPTRRTHGQPLPAGASAPVGESAPPGARTSPFSPRPCPAPGRRPSAVVRRGIAGNRCPGSAPCPPRPDREPRPRSAPDSPPSASAGTSAPSSPPR